MEKSYGFYVALDAQLASRFAPPRLWTTESFYKRLHIVKTDISSWLTLHLSVVRNRHLTLHRALLLPHSIKHARCGTDDVKALVTRVRARLSG